MTIAQNTLNKVDFAILSALPEELAFIVQQFKHLRHREVKVNDFTFTIYNYRNHHVLIAYTGIGSVFAASVFTLINVVFQPNNYLITGTAGGINQDLKIRDVIIAENAFEAEIQDMFTNVKNTPFESCLVHPMTQKSILTHYPADNELLAICDYLHFNDIAIHRGTVVSSNIFPAPNELFEQIKRHHPYSIDMETAAFYQTAWLLHAKVLSIRGISNLLDADGKDDNIHVSDIKGSSLAAATVLLAVLDKSIELRD